MPQKPLHDYWVRDIFGDYVTSVSAPTLRSAQLQVKKKNIEAAGCPCTVKHADCCILGD